MGQWEVSSAGCVGHVAGTEGWQLTEPAEPGREPKIFFDHSRISLYFLQLQEVLASVSMRIQHRGGHSCYTFCSCLETF